MTSLEQWRVKQAVLSEILRQGPIGDLEAFILSFLKESGLDSRLKNDVYDEELRKGFSKRRVLDSNDDIEYDYIATAQAAWARTISTKINFLSKENGITLARRRVIPANVSRETWIDRCPILHFKGQNHIFTQMELLHTISQITNPNFQPMPDLKGIVLGRMKLQFACKSSSELMAQFSDLGGKIKQTGIDDMSDDQFADLRFSLGNKVAESGDSVVARVYARRGIPTSLRAELWLSIFNVSLRDAAVHFDQLKEDVLDHDMLIDQILLNDVKDCCNDDIYFVFEDNLKEVMLAFTRDTDVPAMYPQGCSPMTPCATIKGRRALYPPNGVLPYKGFSMLAAPISFLCAEASAHYFLFRKIYARYFFHLHTISSHPQGIVRLCCLFESLLQLHQPLVCVHLAGIGFDPLTVAFSWIMQGFAGFLPVEQVLLLWDRILGFDTLELLPILAAAIFSFRRNALLQVETSKEAEVVLEDLKALNAISLIQYSIFVLS